MSIAVSAFVRPSRTARRLLAAWSLAQCAAAWAVGCGAPARFAGAALIAALLAAAGLLLGGRALRHPKMHRIDISGTGELRVTVQQDVRLPRPDRQARHAGSDGPPLVLLPGSARWPGLMVLRLGGAAPTPPVAPFCLPIWRDSVDDEAWRALAVALAVIGRPGRAEGGIDHKR